jgi:E3 ubiquitin-protein ligase BAH
MKFGQDYQAALQREEFPRDWVESAISYKKLKKCIKRVQQELNGLGLDQDTLNALWQHVSTGTEALSDDNVASRMLHYTFDGNDKVRFIPKLTIALDPRDGSPMDAWLSPSTRRHLRRLSRNSKPLVHVERELSPPVHKEGEADNSETDATEATDTTEASEEQQQSEVETVEIPLTSDSEFFQILRRELRSLDGLQHKEQQTISDDISRLAHQLQDLKASKKKRSKQDIEQWRRLFELYAESEVFRSSHEADAGARDVEHAQKQLQLFTKSVQEQRMKGALVSKESNEAMDRFLKINIDLLRLMRFQEMNRIALSKILKKFDKRTALHARAAIPESLRSGAAVSQDLARGTCYTIANELMSVIPQVNDYLCPVCFSITYKPVRLACNHVFCIRCLIIMQREEQSHCPMCRADVVLKADSGESLILTWR